MARSSYIRSTTRLAVYLRDGRACVYCGWDIDMQDRFDDLDTMTQHRLQRGTAQAYFPGNHLTLDHVVSRREYRQYGGKKRGKPHDARNLLTCCHRCNSLKAGRGLFYLCWRLSLDYEAVRDRSNKARKARMTRHKRKAAATIGLLYDGQGVRLDLFTIARCPWCDHACAGCVEGLVESRLSGVTWRAT